MNFLILIYFILSAGVAISSTNLCDIIDTGSCHGVTKQSRRSSSLSLPSPASSALTNPATVSFDRGLGVEILHQSHNALGFNVASGTGKMGGALISHSLENSFFGNRVVETDEVYRERREEKKQYDSKKINLALGVKLLRRKLIHLDAGVLLKRHSDIKRINPGAGISGRIGLFTLGASYYQDDFHLKLGTSINPYTHNSYTERFLVESYSLGTKIKNLNLDAGIIKTRYQFYEEDSRIFLYSAGLHIKNVLVNLAIRKELSSALKYENGEMIDERQKNEAYGGIQFSFSKHVILGVQYNYFLLRELSFSMTLFL